MRTLSYPATGAERSVPATSARDLSTPLTKTIPFDYVFEFKLSGKPANNVQDVVKLQDVVEISMQGVFVAVSLGYSFVLDERVTPRSFGAVINDQTVPQEPVVIPIVVIQSPVIFAAAGSGIDGILIAGMPNTDMTILRQGSAPGTFERAVVAAGGAGPLVADFIEVTRPPLTGQTDVIRTGSDGTMVVQFKPAASNGILRVWDRATNFFSEPFDLSRPVEPVVGPDPVTRRKPTAGDQTVNIYGVPGDSFEILLIESGTGKAVSVTDPSGVSVFPLDVVSNFGQTVGRAQVKLFVNGADRKLSPGDLLLTRRSPPAAGSTGNLFAVSSLRLSTIPLTAIAGGLAEFNLGLASGFRLSQRAANVFAAGDPPLDLISKDILERAFEPACGAEDVSFLYSIDVVSTGRELQNRPIHNIAGLGIANGDRPFRPFARPIAFEPRSVIRIQIEELSTLPGTLYIVLQGYKILGTGRIPE